MRKLLTAVLFSISFIPAFSQSSSIDSLRNALAHATADTVKVSILNKLSEATMNMDAEKALSFSNEAVNIIAMSVINTGSGIPENLQAETYYQQSRVLQFTGRFDNAVSSSKMALKLAHDKQLQYKSANITGNCYFEMGSYPQALEYYYKSLQLAEQFADKNKTGISMNNIGLVYFSQGNYQKAVECYQKSRQLFAEAGNTAQSGGAWNNLGQVFSEWNKNDSALKCFSEAEKIFRNSNDNMRLANTLEMLGNAEMNSNSGKAFDHLSEALKIMGEVNDKNGICSVHTELGKLFLYKYKTWKGADDLKKAEDHLKQAETIANQINTIYDLKEIYESFSELYVLKNDYKSAYNYLKRYQTVNDSLTNETMTQKIVQMETQYEIDKKQHEMELLQMKTQLNELQLEKTRLQKQVDANKNNGFNTGH